MQTILDILKKAGGWHPGLYLKIDNAPYMELVIEAMDESGPMGLPALSVAHYGEQNGDAMRDPEMCFELGLYGEFTWFLSTGATITLAPRSGAGTWSQTTTCTCLSSTPSISGSLRCGTGTCVSRALSRLSTRRNTHAANPLPDLSGGRAAPPLTTTTPPAHRRTTMQNSSEFQYIAVDTIHESATNPRRTFDECKLGELAESIRTNGLIQPITVRPNAQGFEIVAGARRFRAAQLAELFSLPARIVDINDAQALEWQLVENSQRVDVHPYEEAQGFQRLLDMPGYDVATLVEKSGKSAAHVYARLSLLQLVPSIAEAFSAERITASHANLLARLPQDAQANAYEQCWRKDWQDKEPHLLPAKHLSAWIQTNLYLSLAEAPFDKDDPTLNPPAGACVTCPRRSGFNTSLFADVQGDQCLDAPCFHTKVNAHIDREVAAQPELIQIENGYRAPKEQRPGAVRSGTYREIDTTSQNPDAEPVAVCESAKPAIIVYGKRVGTTLTVCTDNNCPIHDPRAAAKAAEHPAPVMPPAPPAETEEEAEARKQQHEEQRKAHEAEQERRAEEFKQQGERQEQRVRGRTGKAR